MSERLLVYKQKLNSYPEKFSVMIVDYDRKKVNYVVAKRLSFLNPRDKSGKSVNLFERLKKIAKENDCSLTVGDQEFRINYMFEKYHEDKNIKKTKSKKK